jgi:hypothetical protein
MGYAEDHTRWLDEHRRRRKGERKGRLERGHGHGDRMFLERVWWPILGNLADLHPEYEVMDWRGRPIYVDIVWTPGHCKFAFEIKGYGPHVQNTDRIRYRSELNRETYLQTLGFRVVSIPYDTLEEQPELLVSLVRSLLTPYMATGLRDQRYSRLERETMHMAMRNNKPIRPVDLVVELEIHRRTAVRVLKSLCDKGRMRGLPKGTSHRVSRYELIRSFGDDLLW